MDSKEEKQEEQQQRQMFKTAGKFRPIATFGLLLFHTLAFLALTVYNESWIYDSTLIKVQIILQVIVGISTTAGAHRCFCHQSYDARLPLILFYLLKKGTFVFQKSKPQICYSKLEKSKFYPNSKNRKKDPNRQRMTD